LPVIAAALYRFMADGSIGNLVCAETLARVLLTPRVWHAGCGTATG
jgi:hypothetical protein